MDSILAAKSTDFALRVITYYRWLADQKKEFVLSKQLLRSATSIGANISEANYAASRADFVSKMQIAVKEAAETEYWLLLLDRSGFSDDSFSDISPLLDEIKRMLVSTLNTAKKNAEKK